MEVRRRLPYHQGCVFCYSNDSYKSFSNPSKMLSKFVLYALFVFVCALRVKGLISVGTVARRLPSWKAATPNETPQENSNNDTSNDAPVEGRRYNLGLGKNPPVGNNITVVSNEDPPLNGGRKLVPKDKESESLTAALWDESHYRPKTSQDTTTYAAVTNWGLSPPVVTYPDIDLSIPESVYAQDGSVDRVWDLLRYEAYQESLREPLLVSFLHSTILNHPSLESSLAFLLANRLQSPAMMISTQLQSLILEALHESPDFRRALRADIMAVRDRDPACNTLPDVFLYFKGVRLRTNSMTSSKTKSFLSTLSHFIHSFIHMQVSRAAVVPRGSLLVECWQTGFGVLSTVASFASVSD